MMAGLGAALPAAAQQPFVVDDAEVTPPGRWHVEIASQLDGLRAAARPVRRQNAVEVEIVRGVVPRLELAAALPIVSLFGGAGGGWDDTSGVGDASLGAKLRLTRDPAARHAVAVNATLELPSGDRDRNLGSGLVDYGVMLGSQHRLGGRWTARINAGVVLAGNTQTGVVGIRERGTVVNGGGSLVALAGRFVLGGEFTAAWSQKAVLGNSFASAQIGGNVRLTDGCTLDLGLGTGWFDTSPRWSVQLGLSADLGSR